MSYPTKQYKVAEGKELRVPQNRRYTVDNPSPAMASLARYITENPDGIEGLGIKVTAKQAMAFAVAHPLWQRSAMRHAEWLAERQQRQADKDAAKKARAAERETNKAKRAADKTVEIDGAQYSKADVRKYLAAEKKFNADVKRWLNAEERHNKAQQKAADDAAKKADRDKKAADDAAAKADREKAAAERKAAAEQKRQDAADRKAARDAAKSAKPTDTGTKTAQRGAARKAAAGRRNGNKPAETTADAQPVVTDTVSADAPDAATLRGSRRASRRRGKTAPVAEAEAAF